MGLCVLGVGVLTSVDPQEILHEEDVLDELQA